MSWIVAKPYGDFVVLPTEHGSTKPKYVGSGIHAGFACGNSRWNILLK